MAIAQSGRLGKADHVQYYSGSYKYTVNEFMDSTVRIIILGRGISPLQPSILTATSDANLPIPKSTRGEAEPTEKHVEHPLLGPAYAIPRA